MKVKDYENKNVDYAFLCYYYNKPGYKKFQCHATQIMQEGRILLNEISTIETKSLLVADIKNNNNHK